jgi:predicted house-cleaning noncanonical NTP pyrophosphatase (MazG superfamily)
MIGKLVRNGPGQRIRTEGGKVRVAQLHEMQLLLARKLVEEAQEVLAIIQAIDREGFDREAIIEELADVAEVIHAFRGVTSVKKDEVRSARRDKTRRQGDFDERLVWECE